MYQSTGMLHSGDWMRFGIVKEYSVPKSKLSSKIVDPNETVYNWHFYIEASIFTCKYTVSGAYKSAIRIEDSL